MFSSLVCTPDTTYSAVLAELAIASRQVSIYRTLDRYVQPFELVRLMNTVAPEIVFLDFEQPHRALEIWETVRQLSPETAVIGFRPGGLLTFTSIPPQQIAHAWLPSPLALAGFVECVDAAIHKVRAHVQQNVRAFLPAKAGNGATTVALNVAGCLAGETAGRTLLVEGDFHSGIISTLLNLTVQGSVRDALRDSAILDSTTWRNYVVAAGKLDLLLADRTRPDPLPLWSDYHHLLRFAGSRYDQIVVDLPEVVNEATIEIVRRAEMIYIVSTAEVPSLKLAQHRYQDLLRRHIGPERIRLLVNRYHRSDIESAEIENIVGCPVTALFPNDYRGIQRATMASAFVRRNTALGQAYMDFAKGIVSAAHQDSDEPAKAKSPGPAPKFSLGRIFG